MSIGLADSTWSSDLTDVLRAADHALMEAKAQGRDRLVIADPPAPGGIVPGPGPGRPTRLSRSVRLVVDAAGLPGSWGG